MKKTLSVTLPVHTQSHLTRRCLGSLLQNSREVLEVIAIDNGSRDDTASVLEHYRSRFERAGIRFEVITNSENEGFAQACNQGIFASSGKWIAVLRSDTWVMPKWDTALREAAERLNADLVGPYSDEDSFDEERMKDFVEEFLADNRGRWVRDWASSLMLFRRDSLLRLNGFDPKYLGTLAEPDLRHRMDLEGMKYYQVGDCVIWRQAMAPPETDGTRNRTDTQDHEHFRQKWGFDPGTKDATLRARVRRTWKQVRNAYGFL